MNASYDRDVDTSEQEDAVKDAPDHIKYASSPEEAAKWWEHLASLLS